MATQEEVDNLDLVGKSPLPAPKTDASNFNEQEKYLYEHHLQNLADPVNNDDGSYSTLRAFTTTIDGRAYILPSVWNGKLLDPDKTKPPVESIAAAQSGGPRQIPVLRHGGSGPCSLRTDARRYRTG